MANHRKTDTSGRGDAGKRHGENGRRGAGAGRRQGDHRGHAARFGKPSRVGSSQRSRVQPSGKRRHTPQTGSSTQPAPGAPLSSKERKAAAGPCPLMHACGGCSWIGMPYRKQLARKQQMVEELFGPVIAEFGWGIAPDAVLGMRMLDAPGADGGRAGLAGDVSASPALASDPLRTATVTIADGKLAAPRGFRHKAATPFAPGPEGTVRGGFYARGTHDIIEVPACPVEAPGARQILNDVARLAGKLGIPAYDEDRGQGILRYAVLRLGWRRPEGMLTLVTARRNVPELEELARQLAAAHPQLTCIAQNINGRPGNAILGHETRPLWGSACMRDELLGCTFEISPTAFYQTNPQQTEVLYRLAIEGMGLRSGDVLMDAYCGSGTIGITAVHAARAAGRDVRLLGVERNPAGIADARRNAELNGLAGSCEFVAEDATSYLRRDANTGAHVDVLVMDPPRAGSTPEFLAAAAAMGPRRIVYVSCNPATLARDLADLGRAGYRLVRLTPVDMFPHTEHIEMVAVLER